MKQEDIYDLNLTGIAKEEEFEERGKNNLDKILNSLSSLS